MINKNKIVAGILAIVLGSIGIHKFYLGDIKKGLIYFLFSWTFIPAILGLIDGVRILTTNKRDFNHRYNYHIIKEEYRQKSKLREEERQKELKEKERELEERKREREREKQESIDRQIKLKEERKQEQIKRREKWLEEQKLLKEKKRGELSLKYGDVLGNKLLEKREDFIYLTRYSS